MKNTSTVLLVDAGNTRVKFGWLREGHSRREPQTLALPLAELGRLEAWLDQLPRVPNAALGVSVAGSHLNAMLERVLTRRNIPLRWLRSSESAAGIMNLYDEPGQLGNDRWISLIGLSRHTEQAAILASFGTATTIDTLGPLSLSAATAASHGSAASTRRFEGGVILPGPELMRRSLASGTAGLPYAEGDSAAFPRNTHSAITTGIAAAQAGAVIRQWRCAVASLGVAPQLYCTGGGWPLVEHEVNNGLALAQSDLKMPLVAPQWLEAPVLDGLAAMVAA